MAKVSRIDDVIKSLSNPNPTIDNRHLEGGGKGLKLNLD